MFSNMLGKLVHTRLLNRLLDNSLLTECKYVFLPGKYTHEVIFNMVKHLHSAINNNKLMGLWFLDIAKAFNCVNHEI